MEKIQKSHAKGRCASGAKSKNLKIQAKIQNFHFSLFKPCLVICSLSLYFFKDK